MFRRCRPRGAAVLVRCRDGHTLLIWAVIWLGYFVFLKGSRYRTLGYILTRAKILNLQGERPSFWQLFIRFLFSVFGPLNLAFDLLWIPSDPSGQALRDKFAGTYVVKQLAIPIGQGRIVYVPYTMFGQSYIFREVRETPSITAP
ncbi:MAG: RDD family protein [Thermoanaerobaculia bacterium]